MLFLENFKKVQVIHFKNRTFKNRKLKKLQFNCNNLLFFINFFDDDQFEKKTKTDNFYTKI